jgi:toxin ParE1/3/4
MADYPVRILAGALAEIESARTWYEADSSRSAANFMAEIDEAIEQVARFPDRWRRDLEGTRRYLLGRFPFAVIYRQMPDEIQVVAVAHGSRRPEYWRNRLRD